MGQTRTERLIPSKTIMGDDDGNALLKIALIMMTLLATGHGNFHLMKTSYCSGQQSLKYIEKN